jgi:hypothetical protein
MIKTVAGILSASRSPWWPLAAAALTVAACASNDQSTAAGAGGEGGGWGPANNSSSAMATSTGSGGAGPGGSGPGSGPGGATGSGSTTTSSGTGGSGSDDPCSNAPADGNFCGSELGGLAAHTSVYTCSGGMTVTVMPCQAGCSNGSCNPVQSDPCASAQYGNGAYCGGSLLGGDPNGLYNCQNQMTASKMDCPNGCKVNPPGVADACNPSGDPCANATSGNGLYCGGPLGGDANVLYNCQNQATASQTTCPNGCQINPPGTSDACSPTGGGTCCANHPPGVVTQAYSACGSGGSHYGIDYGTAINTPIYAPLAGTVTSSALGFPNCYNNGCSQSCWNAFNYVKIKSDCGDPNDASRDFFIYYLHIESLGPGIQNGAHVDQGQLLAYSGNSGCSSGPHIHIETVSVTAGASASLSTCNSVNPASRFCP